jgi:alpha-1,6-mannosyltransferase
MGERLTRLRAPGVLALGFLLLGLELWLRREKDLETQVAGQVLAFALFLPVAFTCWRGIGIGRAGLVLVLVLAVALRAAVFQPSASPPLSTDLHRYAWDGRVQASGSNPYRYPPSHPALERLRDREIWPMVNLKTWPTVYPPGAEASFLAARGAFGSGVRATTWLFLAAEALAAALLLLVLARAGAPLERVALFAWHPLGISEVAGNGHVDVLAALAVAALLVAWQARRFALAGAAVAVGALVKLGPVLLLPALARRGGRRFAVAAIGLVVLAYLPYLSVGTAVLGSLGRYVERQHFGGSLFWALDAAIGGAAAGLVLAVALAALVAVVALREHDSVEQVARSGLLVLGGLLLVAGYVQPWHALVLLPFLAVTPAPGWLWFTGVLPLLYLYGPERELPLWVRPVVYGPLAGWVLWRVLAPRRRRPLSMPPLPVRTRVTAIIPALNEAEALPALLEEFPPGCVDEVIVVDGGSSDGTAASARAAGARVVIETRRGYGRACAAGAAATDADVLVFLDGDGSDDPIALPRVLEPVLAGRVALSLGARGDLEPGALKPHQRFGNLLVAILMRAVYGLRVTDVPPLRAIRRDTLEAMALREMTYGWPTEMMVKAARAGLPVAEVDVRSRLRRGGASKISGRIGPSARAGALMLTVMMRHS